MCKEVNNLHTLMFSVFLLKPPGLWNPCQEVDTKIDSQHTVKKVLDFGEK